jgi:hypothetical protein
MLTGSVSPAAWASRTFTFRAYLNPLAQKAVELPALLQNIQAPQRGDDLLAHRLAAPHAAGDLQIAVSFGGLDSEKHGGLWWTPQK